MGSEYDNGVNFVLGPYATEEEAIAAHSRMIEQLKALDYDCADEYIEVLELRTPSDEAIDTIVNWLDSF
jgi:hypothetical protein